MKVTRTRAAGIALMAAIIGGAVWSYHRSDRNATNALPNVVIAQVADFFLYAPLYIAQDAGLFRSAGIDVSIVTAGGDDKAWAAVLSRSAQFAIGDPTFIAIAAQLGQAGRVVTSVVNGVPFWGVAFRQNIPVIDNPSLLRGFTVATFPAPSTAYMLQAAMFREAGLEPSIRQGSFGSLLTLTRAGQADIALELEPNVSTAVADHGGRVVYSLARIYGDFAITGLSTTPSYIRDYPDRVQKVVCALGNALKFIRENPDESLRILQRRFPEVSPTVASAAFRRVVEEGIIPSQPEISETAWSRAIELRTQAGDVRSPGAMDQYVDNQFARAAAGGRCAPSSREMRP